MPAHMLVQFARAMRCGTPSRWPFLENKKHIPAKENRSLGKRRQHHSDDTAAASCTDSAGAGRNRCMGGKFGGLGETARVYFGPLTAKLQAEGRMCTILVWVSVPTKIVFAFCHRM